MNIYLLQWSSERHRALSLLLVSTLFFVMSSSAVHAQWYKFGFGSKPSSSSSQGSSSNVKAEEISCELSLAGLFDSMRPKQIVGRSSEKTRLSSALQSGQHAFLVGPSGSGRTSIIEGLAGEEKIYRLDWNRLVSLSERELGKSPESHFADRLKMAESEAAKTGKKPVLYIENASEFFAEIRMESSAARRTKEAENIRANILQKAREGKIQIVGELQSMAELHGIREFSNAAEISVKAPELNETRLILLSQLSEISERYDVSISPEVIDTLLKFNAERERTPSFEVELLRAVANEFSGRHGSGFKERAEALQQKIDIYNEYLPKEALPNEPESLRSLRLEREIATRELSELVSRNESIEKRGLKLAELHSQIREIEQTIQSLSGVERIGAEAELKMKTQELASLKEAREEVTPQMVNQFLSNIERLSSNPEVPEKLRELGIGGFRFQLVSDLDRITFDDIAGLNSTKEEIYSRIVGPQAFQGITRLAGTHNGFRGIFYGAPGNGKTLLFKASAVELGAEKILIVKASDFMNPYVGGTQKAVTALFDQIRAEAKKTDKPILIILDEIDAIGMNRTMASSGIAEVVNQLLVELDGAGGKLPGNVHIMGATNRPDILDPALTRPGRLSQQIFIPLPDVAARAEMLEIGFRKSKDLLAEDVQFGEMAGRLENWSGASIMEGLVNETKQFWLDKVRGEFMKTEGLSWRQIAQMSEAERAQMDAKSLEFATSASGQALKVSQAEMNQIIERLIERRSGPVDPQLIKMYQDYQQAGKPPEVKPEEVGTREKDASGN